MNAIHGLIASNHCETGVTAKGKQENMLWFIMHASSSYQRLKQLLLSNKSQLNVISRHSQVHQTKNWNFVLFFVDLKTKTFSETLI